MSTIENNPSMRTSPSRRDAIVIALVLSLGAITTAAAATTAVASSADSEAVAPLPTVWPPEPEPEPDAAELDGGGVRVLIEGDAPLAVGVEIPRTAAAVAVPPQEPVQIPSPE